MNLRDKAELHAVLWVAAVVGFAGFALYCFARSFVP